MITKNTTNSIAIVLAVSLALYSCRQLDLFEKNQAIPNYQWQYNFAPGFDFEIKDTIAYYNIFVVLRHTDAYRYNNIWLKIAATSGKNDTLFTMPHHELQLGNDAKGWEGTGMDDIWEVRKPLTKSPVQFKKPGLYHFSVAQVMRENPLLNILSVGIRVEKTK